MYMLTKNTQQKLKQNISKYPIDNPIYVYTIVIKQSASTLFNNQRLLYINLEDKSINYANLDKYQPFMNGQKPKPKGTISIINNGFKYLRVKQKQPTLKIWQQKDYQQPDKKLHDWKFQFFNQDVMVQFVHLINFIYTNGKGHGLSSAKPSDFMQSYISPNNKNQGNKFNQNNKNKPTPQSPIHKLQDLQSGKNNPKQSPVDNQKYKKGNQDNKNNNISPNNKQQIEKIKLNNSVPDQQRNKLKSPNYSQPKNQGIKPNNNNYAPSKQQKSYYNSPYQKEQQFIQQYRSSKTTKIKQQIKNHNGNKKYFQKNRSQGIQQRERTEQQEQQYEQYQYNQNRNAGMGNNPNKSPNQKQFDIGSTNEKKIIKQLPLLGIQKIDTSKIKSYRQEGYNSVSQDPPSQSASQNINKKSRVNILNQLYNSRKNQHEKSNSKSPQKNNMIRALILKNNGFQAQISSIHQNHNQEISKDMDNNLQDYYQKVQLSGKRKKLVLKEVLQIDKKKDKNVGPNISNPDLNDSLQSFGLSKQKKNLSQILPTKKSNKSLSNEMQKIPLKRQKSQMSQNSKNSNDKVKRQKKQKYTQKQLQMLKKAQQSILRQKQLQRQLNLSKTLVKKQDQLQNSKFIDWNRQFIQSNYSIQVYKQFTTTCMDLITSFILTQYLQSTQNQPSTLFSNSIAFSIHKHTSSISQPGPKPILFSKQFPNKKVAQINDIVNVYCRIKNQIEQKKSLWKSNRYIMQKLLQNKLQKQQKNKSKPGNIIIDNICIGLCCWFQYLGYNIYCQAQLSQNQYELIQNWQKQSEIRDNLSQIQQLINLQIPNTSIQIHKCKYKQQYLLQLLNPIFLPMTNSQTITQYINPLTIQKNIIPNSTTIFNPLSVKLLQQRINKQMQYQLIYNLNNGYRNECSQNLYAICGSKQYQQIMQYYNIGPSKINNLYKLIRIDYYRQIIATQRCADVFITLFTYTFHQQVTHQYKLSQLITNISNNKPSSYPTLPYLKNYYKEMLYTWLNNLLSSNYAATDGLWSYISQIVYKVYQIDCRARIQATLPGYLLDFVMKKLMIQLQCINRPDGTQFYKSNGNSKNKTKGTKVKDPYNKNTSKDKSFNRSKSRSRSRSRSRSHSKLPNIKSENILYQFPQRLNFSYMHQNILNFLVPLQTNVSQNQNEENIETMMVNIQKQQYRASRFKLAYCLLQQKVLTQLLVKNQIYIQSAAVVSGKILKFSNIKYNKTQISLPVLQIIQQINIQKGFPAHLKYLQPYINLHLSHTIDYKNNKKYQHLHIYNTKKLPILSNTSILSLIPHSSTQIQIYIQIIKKLLYKNENNYTNNHNYNQALYLFNCILQQNVFWGTQFNPYMTKLYILLSNYCITKSDYPQAIKYYKSALMIYIKIYPNSTLIADRHCYLTYLLCKDGKYSQAIKQIQCAIVNYYFNIKTYDHRILSKDRTYINMLDSQINQNINQQPKILILKYIRSTIKRSKILLKSLKYQRQQLRYSSNPLSSQQNIQIVSPLISIINQLKQQPNTQYINSIPNTQFFYTQRYSAYSVNSYILIQSCPPFISLNILKHQDIVQQTIQIIQLIFRSFQLSAKIPQLSVLILEDMFNPKISQSIAANLQCFIKMMKIIIFYQFRYGSRTAIRKNGNILAELISNIWQNSNDIDQISAYRYLYNKYFKNNRDAAINYNRQKQSQNRQRSRSSGKTKKNQRPMSLMLIKRLSQNLKKLQKLSKQIQKNRLVQKHIALNENVQTQTQQFIVLIQAISQIVGYNYILALLQNDNEEYYCSNFSYQMDNRNSNRGQEQSYMESIYNGNIQKNRLHGEYIDRYASLSKKLLP